MRKDGKKKSIQLPGQILDELASKSEKNDGDDSRFHSTSSNFKRKRNDSTVSRKEKRKEERKSKKMRRVHTEEHSKPNQETSKSTSNLKSTRTKEKSKAKFKKAVSFANSEVFDFDAEMAPGHRTGSAKIQQLNESGLSSFDLQDDFDLEDDDDFDEDDFNGFDSEDDGQDSNGQTVEDTWAALKAMKEKKNDKSKLSKIGQGQPKSGEETMAALKAAKANKKAKGKEPETVEETMAALKAAKANKNTKDNQPKTVEETMAALKAAKANKKAKGKEPDTVEETMEALKVAKVAKAAKKPKDKGKGKEPETAEETMALLKAAKAKKSLVQESFKKKGSLPVKSSLADLIKAKESNGTIGSSDTSNKKKTKVVLTPEEKRLMKKDEDDIEYYTRMLGMKDKHSKMPKSEGEEDDGLDDLLDGLDLDFGSGYDNLDENSDDEVPNLVGENNEDGEIDESIDEDILLEGLPFSSDDELNSDDFDSDISMDNEGEDESQADDVDNVNNSEEDDEDDDESSEEDVAVKENPYVAPVSTGKYVPPSVRRRLEAASGDDDSEELVKLRRLAKGLFNRLTEANIASIVQELDRLYMNYPRHHLTSIISSIVIDSTALQGTLLDTFLMVHAALVTALYRTSGLEFGAHFLQSLVEAFDKYYKQAMESNKKSFGKEANNLLSLLAELYSFQFVSCGLIYDLIRMFLDGDIDEAKTELLLKLVRASGSQLRSDDPAALKEIIYQLQVSVSNADPGSINTRTKFLVETISELKNNRQKRAAAAVSETTSAAKTRMKKFLGTIQGKMSEPLRVSLDDIRNVETRGKWWLVGSAWRNNSGSDGNKSLINGNIEEADIDHEAMDDILENAEPDWMELARQQRMNTDVRRAVFIALMSSEDYVDACDRLQRLKLKSKQEREIPRVILHCCCNEEVYNPFYSVVATRLCAQRSIRKTFQFALWDFLADLEGGVRDDDDEDESDLDPEEKMEKLKRRGDIMDDELTDEQKLRKTVHMARLYASLTAEGITSLSILKTANFVSPSSETKIFLELFFITLYTQLARKQSSQSNTRKKMSFGDSMFQKQKIDEKGLVQLIIKTASSSEDSHNLMKKIKYFQKKLLKSSAITNSAQREKVEWGVNITSDVIDDLNSKSSI